MSASHALALHGVALQLAASLDQYEAQVAEMLETWPDLERYAAVSARVEEIRGLAAAMPPLSAEWVELLIAHAELVHCLWRQQYGQASGQVKDLGELRSHHGCCITALRAGAGRMARRYAPR